MDAEPAIREALPPSSGILGPRAQALARLADLGLGARQRALGIGRLIDREAAEAPSREVLVAGVYGPEGAELMAAALELLSASRHRVRAALGALGPAAPRLRDQTIIEDLEGGKFANFNRLVERSQALAADWVVLLDDDVVLPRRFTDRAVHLAERFRFDLAQPALTRASHTAWPVFRRRADIARETRAVEIGPVTLISKQVLRRLHPLPEIGMGWGLDLHWAALAREHGWRLGVLDAVPVRHEGRAPAAGYDRGAAIEDAARFLRGHVHLPFDEASRVLAVHRTLPR